MRFCFLKHEPAAREGIDSNKVAAREATSIIIRLVLCPNFEKFPQRFHNHALDSDMRGRTSAVI